MTGWRAHCFVGAAAAAACWFCATAHAAANALLRREYRAGWGLGTVTNVASL